MSHFLSLFITSQHTHACILFSMFYMYAYIRGVYFLGQMEFWTFSKHKQRISGSQRTFFFFAALGLCCCSWVFSTCDIGVRGLLIMGLLLSRIICLDVWAQKLWHMGLVTLRLWNIPRPGIEPMSPALAGRFLTTGPQGSPQRNF